MLLLSVLLGIALLLLLILYFRLNAFIALLIASIVVGLVAGQSATQVLATMQEGMGGTLGFVATVVGLGAMFGAILEHTGGAGAIAHALIGAMGIRRAPLAMVLSGFVIAIPVFFDVAFIILAPVIYALQRQSGKSLLLYAIPLLAGLAITHAFIPPTPGPVAVADIIGANLGWVILLGLIAGIPAALVGGLFFGRYIAGRIPLEAPEMTEGATIKAKPPPVGMILAIIALPIVLILLNTLAESGLLPIPEGGALPAAIRLLGHPFSALILANLLAWRLLGIRRGLNKKQLFEITSKSMMPAGTIILLTGAGGVFKQMLVDTGAGEMLARSLTDLGLPVLVFAFLAAVLIRVVQGSATVAMITSAGLVAPLLAGASTGEVELAMLVIAIASGATIFSHVNDSGFWLVSQYLGLSEKQTFRSWTMMTTVVAVVGFLTVLALWGIW